MATTKPGVQNQQSIDEEKLFSLLLQEQGFSVADECRIQARKTRSFAPLSFFQQRLWVNDKLYPGRTDYNMSATWRIGGKLSVKAIKQSLELLVNQHEILRTTFEKRGEDIVQVIHADMKPCWIETNVTDIDEPEKPVFIKDLIQKETVRPFDLLKGPLLRTAVIIASNDEYIIQFTIHHIISDDWSIRLFLNGLSSLYESFVAGTPPVLPFPAIQYADYADWILNNLQEDDMKRQFQYWKQQLLDAPPLIELPLDRMRPGVRSPYGAIRSFQLDRELSEMVKILTKGYGSTTFMTLLTAFSVLLHRYNEKNDIIIGTPISGRNKKELEPVIGLFINMLVLRIDFSDRPDFLEMLKRVKKLSLNAFENQDFPFEKLVELLNPERSPSYTPFFQVMFMMQGDEIRHFTLPGLSVDLIPAENSTAKFDLTLCMRETTDGLKGYFEYSTDLFEGTTIDRMVDHFKTLLKSMVSYPRHPVCLLEVLSMREKDMLAKWNETYEFISGEQFIHGMIESAVKGNPDAIAVVFEDTQLTYAELNTWADQVAFGLGQKGVEPGMLVGIYIERSTEMIVGVLGILKAGCAYVPLDPSYPYERLAFILEDAGILFLLARNEVPDNLVPAYISIIFIENCRSEETLDVFIAGESRPAELAYVIYTSGSTGLPKGVPIRHAAVANFMKYMTECLSITERDRWLAVTSLSFDISVMELLLPLTVGAIVEVASRTTIMNGKNLLKKLLEPDTTFIQATPTVFKLLLEAGWQMKKNNLSVLCGGESLQRDLADQLADRASVVWNMYGPTETTIWSSMHRVVKGESVVPIGRPIANTQIYLLDRNLQPVPVGIPADLYISGIGLSEGYFKRPQLTRDSFVPAPFNTRPHSLLYKTGDIARYLMSGEIEYLGRSDFQLKLNGHRIEPGEIRQVLNSHENIRDSVVSTFEIEPGKRRLVAYIVLSPGVIMTVKEVYQFLSQKLPSYMLPSFYEFPDELPLTHNGKIDMKALSIPQVSRPELAHEYIAPRNDVEDLLSGIWAAVLGIQKIGIKDNFFELGGASMQAIQVAARAGEAGMSLAPELLFEFQTIEELSIAYRTIAPGQENADCAEDGSPKGTPVVDARANEAANLEELKIATPETMGRFNTIIESIGVYYPPKTVTTEEIIKGCKNTLRFPLERMSGIKSRAMAGDDEFSVDLARKAVEQCLEKSKYQAGDIDLVICCNISRYDNPNTVTCEPSTSVRIKKYFGFTNAIVFDISNACTGVFTGINIVESFLKSGAIRRGMVVSGEYISHLTKTAQLEINSFMDERIACLTVGDSGVAIILENTADKKFGFHDIEMLTLGHYSSYCIAKASHQEHGGAIMLTDAIKLTEVTIREASKHTLHKLRQNEWGPDSFNYIIMHQTSSTSLGNAIREINTLFNKKICHAGNTIDNLAQRGNTSTTTHFVALMDNILNGKIRTGDKILFSISGSGLTIGTALYSLDDLPDRVRLAEKAEKRTREKFNPIRFAHPRVAVKSAGIVPAGFEEGHDTLKCLKTVAEDCLAKAKFDKKDVDLIIYSGVYRSDYVFEPAIAALLAGGLGLNDIGFSTENGEQVTFAFDIFNGAIGFLNACYAGIQMINSGRFKNALLVTSEVENNIDSMPDSLLNIKETGSALLLEQSIGHQGFGNFVFRYFPELMDLFCVHCTWNSEMHYLQIRKDSGLENTFIDCIPHAVNDLLEKECICLHQIEVVLCPQISPEFITRLSCKLMIERGKFVDISEPEHDYYTSSLPYCFDHLIKTGMVRQGDIGLIINVGSGIQIGCACYYF